MSMTKLNPVGTGDGVGDVVDEEDVVDLDTVDEEGFNLGAKILASTTGDGLFPN